MPLARILSRTELGLDAPLVHVEVHLGNGLPAFSIVGLPAPVVRESRERVRSALLNSGYAFPGRRITVNLAPVELSKRGGRFDLPIALGVLVASGQLRVRTAATVECYGELGLGGELKPVRGLFLAALHAGQAGHALIVPSANVAEVALTGLKDVLGVAHLRAAAAALGRIELGACVGGVGGSSSDSPCDREPSSAPASATGTSEQAVRSEELYFHRIVGQRHAKRALVIAAAGAHSVLLIGPPGGGKSLLAGCLPLLLPSLSHAEALEVASIAALAGLELDPRRWTRRPYRAPHHTASTRAIVGGGSVIYPGEISLAHRGVLFLDELPEFDRRVLEALREPLEAGYITLSRSARSLTLPARFQLIAAMNPCPCGYLGDLLQACRCTPAQVARYRQRLSGPLLDRIDMRIEVPRLSAEELAAIAPLEAAATEARGRAIGELPRVELPRLEERAECQAQLVQQVQAARAYRIGCSGAPCAWLSPAQLQRCVRLSFEAGVLLRRSCQKLALSARTVQRLLAIGRTIADLAGSDTIEAGHMAEAIQTRRPVALGSESSLPQ